MRVKEVDWLSFDGENNSNCLIQLIGAIPIHEKQPKLSCA